MDTQQDICGPVFVAIVVSLSANGSSLSAGGVYQPITTGAFCGSSCSNDHHHAWPPFYYDVPFLPRWTTYRVDGSRVLKTVEFPVFPECLGMYRGEIGPYTVNLEPVFLRGSRKSPNSPLI